MKRGFLNTNKAKHKLAEVPDVLTSDTPAIKDKGKGKAVADTDTNKDAGEKTQWRIEADNIGMPTLDAHSIPPMLASAKQHKDSGHNRFIFRQWPRDPNGKTIFPSPLRGKEAGNGLDLWGATLYDFYYVNRVPSIENALTTSTGSKLAKVMRAFDELRHAENEIAWADREVAPKEIPAWDPAEAIVAFERRVHAGSTEQGSTPQEASAAAHDGDVQVLGAPGLAADDVAMEISHDSTDERSNDNTAVQHSPFDIPLESPFHPRHYPSPWLLVPFEGPHTPFILRRAIPIHLLPKKLYVHDPWTLIRTGRDHDAPYEEEDSWTSKPDQITTYTLSLPPEFQEAVAEAASKAAAAATTEAEAAETIFIHPQETQGPSEQPAIRVYLPERPRKPTEVPEAHLYLSPKGALGTGNHSIVYETELELPRNLFCESTYCKSCLDEQIKIELDLLKESGEWEQRMNEAAKKYKGPGKLVNTSSGIASSSSAQLPPRYVGYVNVRLEHLPKEMVGIVDGTTLGSPATDAPNPEMARVSDAAINRYITYDGLVVPIYPDVQWQDPTLPETICKHRAEKYKAVPRTARFRVAAKLSLPGDHHLEREACNYLGFPAHFFQHWSGYNVVPPLHDPVPVGALVPQFFGYYSPDVPPDCESKPESGNDEDESTYCSSILLLEHCGTPISIADLCTDDKHECATLLFRFHAAGWSHGSFVERNILMQKQQPTCSPLEEEDRCEFPHKHRRYSFRLIDFGRSVQRNAPGRAAEEAQGRVMFGLL